MILKKKYLKFIAQKISELTLRKKKVMIVVITKI